MPYHRGAFNAHEHASSYANVIKRSTHTIPHACTCWNAPTQMRKRDAYDGGAQCAECQKKQINGKLLQTKLAISEPGDAYEQEADRVADQVMRMPSVDVMCLRSHRDEPWRPGQDPRATLLPYWGCSSAASRSSNARNNSSAVRTSSSSDTGWNVNPRTRRKTSDAASRFSASARWSNVRRRCSTEWVMHQSV